MKKTIISVILVLALAVSFMSASIFGEGEPVPGNADADVPTEEAESGDVWDTVGKISGAVIIVLALVTAVGFALKSKRKK